MKWLRFCSALVATLGLTTAAHAEILDLFDGLNSHNGMWGGSGKSCGCAPSYQPKCCKPTITKPCDVSVHTYQRKISKKKPPKCCKPAPKCCKPVDCKPRPKCCKQKVKCKPAPKCVKPKKKCCAPKQTCCGSGHGHGGGGLLSKLFGGHSKGVCTKTVEYCCADPCEIAELIYESQTACYDDDRERAIDNLGDYDCVCNPEIMSAMIYALNDASEEVRAEAADEIGDQLRKNPCCCSKEVTAALKTALSDCDRDVRKQAQEALEACGYCVVDGCCDPCGGCGACDSCASGSWSGTGNGNGGNGQAEPAPAPPEDPEAYFPSRLRRHQSSRPSRRAGRLTNLFGLLD